MVKMNCAWRKLMDHKLRTATGIGFRARDVRPGMLVEIEERIMGVQVILKDKSKDLWIVGVPYEWDYSEYGTMKIAGGPRVYLRKPDEPVILVHDRDPMEYQFFDKDCVVLSVGS